MIFVDWLRPCLPNAKWKHDKSCHLLSDISIEELNGFAIGIGLKRSWLQKKKIPHYDLTERMRERAVIAGAFECDKEKFKEIFKNYLPKA